MVYYIPRHDIINIDIFKYTNQFLLNFPLNLVKDPLVTWLLQYGMDYLSILDFHPSSNVV